jgi:phosphomevalonate kinase
MKKKRGKIKQAATVFGGIRRERFERKDSRQLKKVEIKQEEKK